jgi:ubiquinone biosynthesis protein
MGIARTAAHLKRYRDIAWLLVKYGRSDLVRAAGLDDTLQDEPRMATLGATPEAKELAADLEALGPTFVKLGQLLSTRPDLLPTPYLAALARLQDRVEPFAFSEVERIVTSELGVRISKAFQQFDPVPLAAASLGQVHRATLRDGRLVVVKVQRPDIRERVAEDLAALLTIAEFLDAHTEAGARYRFAAMTEEFRASLQRELNYREEAQNLLRLRKNLADFERIVVPAPVTDYTTSRVLTMEYVTGTKVTALSPVVLLEHDGRDLAEQLFRAYLQQVLVDGFFHADPHPGNVFLTADGRLALLDLGMVARVAPSTQDHLLRLLLAVSEGRADDTVACALKLGETRGAVDMPQLTRRLADVVARTVDASLEHLEVGRILLEVTRVCAESGVRLPPELAMLGKALLSLDQIAGWLDPTFNPNDAVRANAGAILQRRLVKSMSPGHLMTGIMEAKELVERLPGRVNTILDHLANNDLRLRVDALDEARLITAFQTIANRITLGLLLAALIIGAALLMRVETSFRLLGYPGLAILFFLLAAGGAVALILDIVIHDERRP